MANYFGVHTFAAHKNNGTSVHVTWVETGLSYEVMELQWSAGTDVDADYARVVSQAQGVNLTFEHTPIAANTVHYYRIRCRKNGRWSNWLKANADTT